jgi:hypothetical protein
MMMTLSLVASTLAEHQMRMMVPAIISLSTTTSSNSSTGCIRAMALLTPTHTTIATIHITTALTAKAKAKADIEQMLRLFALSTRFASQ